MTDHIIKAAQEAGFRLPYKAFEVNIPDAERLARFYAIAFRQGMERAAEICDALQDVPATEARHCAEDIRIEAHAQNQPKPIHDSSVIEGN